MEKTKQKFKLFVALIVLFAMVITLCSISNGMNNNLFNTSVEPIVQSTGSITNADYGIKVNFSTGSIKKITTTNTTTNYVDNESDFTQEELDELADKGFTIDFDTHKVNLNNFNFSTVTRIALSIVGSTSLDFDVECVVTGENTITNMSEQKITSNNANGSAIYFTTGSINYVGNGKNAILNAVLSDSRTSESSYVGVQYAMRTQSTTFSRINNLTLNCIANNNYSYSQVVPIYGTTMFLGDESTATINAITNIKEGVTITNSKAESLYVSELYIANGTININGGFAYSLDSKSACLAVIKAPTEQATNAVPYSDLIVTGYDTTNSMINSPDPDNNVLIKLYLENVNVPLIITTINTPKFDACNGTEITETKPETNPTFKGYTFGGWYTEKNGGGEELTGEPVDGTSYYAKWTKNGKIVITSQLVFEAPSSMNDSDTLRPNYVVGNLETEGYHFEPSSNSNLGPILVLDGLILETTDSPAISFKNVNKFGNVEETQIATIMIKDDSRNYINTSAGNSDGNSYGIFSYGSLNIFGENDNILDYLIDSSSFTSGYKNGSGLLNVSATGTTATKNYGIYALSSLNTQKTTIETLAEGATSNNYGLYLGSSLLLGTTNITAKAKGTMSVGATLNVFHFYTGSHATFVGDTKAMALNADEIDASGTLLAKGGESLENAVEMSVENYLTNKNTYKYGEFAYSFCDHETLVEIVDPQYLKTAATCTNPAEYYKSCADCGKASTETFTSGTALGHTWGSWIVDSAATLDAAGSEHRVCSVCAETETRTIAQLPSTVTFNTNGGSTIEPVDYLKGNNVAKPTDPTKEGYTFVAWYVDETLETEWNFEEDTLTGPTTLYASWYQMSVAIDSVKNSFKPGENVQINCSILGTTGNDQVVWTIEGNTSNDTKITNSGLLTFGEDERSTAITVIATSKTQPNIRQTTVVVLDQANTNTPSSKVNGDKNYIWVILDSIAAVILIGLLIYYFFFKKGKVNYVLNGGTNNGNNPLVLNKKNPAIKLAKPTKGGYVFAGWYLDAEFKNEIKVIPAHLTKDITVFAKWDKK